MPAGCFWKARRKCGKFRRMFTEAWKLPLRNWREITVPRIQANLTYEANPERKRIRVYDSIEVRMTLEDMFAKLQLAYEQ